MNMEVFEAADKVAAVAIAEATAMALLIATVAGGTERKGAADADLLYTKLPEGRALGSGKWDGCCGKRESGIGR
ncbi:GD19514 [Drosophila simulans]|uniref:GD19514 n=1 Tax=Drosophila simulans TaxID=7240 RepID=B4QYY4_DROSI|nr:GD19514 [Drosophila simulans]